MRFPRPTLFVGPEGELRRKRKVEIKNGVLIVVLCGEWVPCGRQIEEFTQR